jgi:cysteinyl-tRNA synthetase
LEKVLDTFRVLAGDVLGLFFEAKTEEFSQDLLEILIAVREMVREKKLWDISDTIRDRLKGVGIVLEDTPEGTRWKFARD